MNILKILDETWAHIDTLDELLSKKQLSDYNKSKIEEIKKYAKEKDDLIKKYPNIKDDIQDEIYTLLQKLNDIKKKENTTMIQKLPVQMLPIQMPRRLLV